MKFFLLSVLCLGAVWAQTPAPAPKPATLPSLPDDKVIMVCTNGSNLKMGDLRTLLGLLDTQNQQSRLADLQSYLDQLCLARELERMAVEDKLEQSSPVKEQIMMERMQVLVDAEINKLNNPPNIDGSELEAFYTQTIAKYQQFKLDDIYIGYTLTDGPQPAGQPKVPTKPEARQKMIGILAKIRAGADFKKLAREACEDDTCREKNGYFETLSPADTNIPDVIRAAIFKLKAGETTDIIEQGPGFYIFKAETVTVKPFAEVRDQVYTDLKAARFRRLIEDMRRKNTAQVAPELLKKEEPGKDEPAKK